MTIYSMRGKKEKRDRKKESLDSQIKQWVLEHWKNTKFQINQNEILEIGNTRQEISVVTESLLNVNQKMQTQRQIYVSATDHSLLLIYLLK